MESEFVQLYGTKTIPREYLCCKYC